MTHRSPRDTALILSVSAYGVSAQLHQSRFGRVLWLARPGTAKNWTRLFRWSGSGASGSDRRSSCVLEGRAGSGSGKQKLEEAYASYAARRHAAAASSRVVAKRARAAEAPPVARHRDSNQPEL
ncbi:hypothetical protein EYF80_026053 [Liparis tanakae]|uniref:Uncharacterized protein n=1 Tax=Liparis tanakae TaxID=230148 RepID=A0A4Z2HDF6_9TELE|nr:hypothetical protein EYF80_026053 [Liparis tanakae]